MAPRNTKRAAKPKPGTLKRNVSFGEDRNGSTRISRPGTSPTTPPGRRYPLTSPPLTRIGTTTPKRSIDSSPQPPPPPKKFGLFTDHDHSLQRTAPDASRWERSDYYWKHHREDPIDETSTKRNENHSVPIMQGLGWERETPVQYETPQRNNSRSPRLPRTPTKPSPYENVEAYYGMPALPYSTGPARPVFSGDGNIFAEETTPSGRELVSAEWVKIRRLQNGLIVIEKEGVWQKFVDGVTPLLEGATSFSKKRASDTQYISDTVYFLPSRQSPGTPTPAARVSKESSARAKKNRKSREKKGLAKLNAGRREKLPHVDKASFEVKRATRSKAKEQDEKFYALP